MTNEEFRELQKHAGKAEILHDQISECNSDLERLSMPIGVGFTLSVAVVRTDDDPTVVVPSYELDSIRGFQDKLRRELVAIIERRRDDLQREFDALPSIKALSLL